MFIRLLPAIFSTILIAAHFSRAGFDALAIAVLALPLSFLLHYKSIPKIWQIFLSLTALTWIYVAAGFVHLRLEAGGPWIRLVIIFAAIVLFNAYSAWSMSSKKIRSHYDSK